MKTLIVVVLLLLGIVPARADCTISKEQFNTLAIGMTYTQVVEVIGCEGELLSESVIGDINTRMYRWSGGSPFSDATVFIQGSWLRFAPQSLQSVSVGQS